MVSLALLAGEAFAPPALAANEAGYAEVVDNAIDGYILPAHRRLYAAATRLAEAMHAFCAAPDSNRSSRVEDGFDRVLSAWAGVEILRLGPLTLDGRYERFSFWPDPHGTGARQLRRILTQKSSDLLRPDVLADESAAIQGLPALEKLLFSGRQALLVAPEPDPFYCDLALAITRNMNAIAGDVLAGWTDGRSWADLMRYPGPDNPIYLQPKDSVTEILRALLTGFEQQHAMLAEALTAPPKTAPRRMPYGPSGKSLEFLHASVQAADALISASGIFDLVQGDVEEVVSSVDTKFENIDWALSSAGPDLAAALAGERSRERLVYTTVILKSLMDLFRRFAPAAGLSAGFNTLDGD